MKFILGTLLILSASALVGDTLPAQSLLDGDVLADQQAKNKLDSRIPPADPRKYEDLRDGNDWLNPFLVIRPDGIEVISKAPSIERKVISRKDLKKTLTSLPVAAWPYGRVISLQEIGIRSGAINSALWRKDEELIEKNTRESNRILASLGLKIKWWPSN